MLEEYPWTPFEKYPNSVGDPTGSTFLSGLSNVKNEEWKFL
jgi:hypothetical protein